MRPSCQVFSGLVLVLGILWNSAGGPSFVGGAITEPVVLGSIRKYTDAAVRVKPVSSNPPWPLHQLHPPGRCPA